MSPASKRQAATHVMQWHDMSERAACRLVGQHRSTQRRHVERPGQEACLLADMRRLSASNPRFGYRRIHQMLLREGWAINHKRVQRLWRREGMRVPRKRLKRRRLGDSSQSCMRRKAEFKNHVWSYDFVFDRLEDGRQVKILTLVDEYTRECLCVHAARSVTAEDLIGLLVGVMVEHGAPKHVRSDNGPEFAAKAVRSWLASLGAETLFVEPGSPWENGYIESFNSRLRDELLNGEIFTSLAEVRYLAETWRTQYNQKRPHSGLDYLTPEEFAASCGPSDSASLRLRAHSSRALQAPPGAANPHVPQLS